MRSFQRSILDVEAVETRELDYIEFLEESATDHKILLFTTQQLLQYYRHGYS